MNDSSNYPTRASSARTRSPPTPAAMATPRSPLSSRADPLLPSHPPNLFQSATIPLSLAGRDIVASAITGSGKTAAYGLPLLERLLHRPKHVKATYVLILVPTRELAVQVHSMMQKVSTHYLNPSPIRRC